MSAGSSVRARVAERTQLSPDIWSFWLETRSIARRARPGQFVQVRIGQGPDPFLRRPISIADVDSTHIRLVLRAIGRGTAALTRRRDSDWDLLGPLGRPAPLIRRRSVLIVGGGIGIAPLLFLARQLAASNKVMALLGARSSQDLILRPEFRSLGLRLELATDDGSLGRRALVTDLLEADLKTAPADAVVFACGPRPMLRRVQELTSGIRAYAFWEERMGCGTGICFGCAVRSANQDRYIRFCTEGPVLDLKEVRF